MMRSIIIAVWQTDYAAQWPLSVRAIAFRKFNCDDIELMP